MKNVMIQTMTLLMLSACGSTKVSVQKPSQGTSTTITVTTNNPITTNVDPTTNVEYKPNKNN